MITVDGQPALAGLLSHTQTSGDPIVIELKRGECALCQEEIVGWVFASFVIADAIRHGSSDWEFQFNHFINGFLEVRSDLEMDEAIEIFQEVLEVARKPGDN